MKKVAAVLIALGVSLVFATLLGTGAQAKKRSKAFVSVTDAAYGAVANDGEDDREAFEAALANTAGPNGSSLPVHVPAGEYDFITSPYSVTLPDGSCIYGDGIGDCIVRGGIVVGSNCIVEARRVRWRLQLAVSSCSVNSLSSLSASA